MKRILIVEDDVNLCLQLSDLLNEFGFETGVADDGLKALAILGECDPLPDFILLDLNMPNMNGWQLRKVLKSNERFCKIPIIVMSGVDTCTEVEAEAHFMKPFDVNALLNKLLH